jgi:hypothetical protein
METTINNISIQKTTRYGHFELSGMVNGKSIKIITTNSEAFDWLNDDENEEKHLEAIAYCERMLEMAYNNN